MPDGSKGTTSSNPKHPSIIALLREKPGEKNAKKIIRSLAKAKIAIALEREWEGPPFCPKIFCSNFGIRCFEVRHDIGCDGRILIGKDGKPRIEFAAGRMEERQRFTIFHEFAHTLFPDFCEFLPHHHNKVATISSLEKEFENLCDVAASEMLLPEAAFVDDLNSQIRLGFQEIKALATRYKASIDATCYRIAELSNLVQLSFVFLTDQAGDFPGRGPLWVKNSSSNKIFKGYIKAGTVPPVNSATIECYQNGESNLEPSKETWWINGAPRSYLVHVSKLPRVSDPSYPKVVALLLPQGYKGGPVFRNC